MKDIKKSFDLFLDQSGVDEVVAGYEELAADDAARKKFNSDVFNILGQHVPQVLFALGLGTLFGGIIKEHALAMGNHSGGDASHGDGHLGIDALNHGGAGGAHEFLGPMSNASADWVAKHVAFDAKSVAHAEWGGESDGLGVEAHYGLPGPITGLEKLDDPKFMEAGNLILEQLSKARPELNINGWTELTQIGMQGAFDFVGNSPMGESYARPHIPSSVYYGSMLIARHTDVNGVERFAIVMGADPQKGTLHVERDIEKMKKSFGVIFPEDEDGDGVYTDGANPIFRLSPDGKTVAIIDPTTGQSNDLVTNWSAVKETSGNLIISTATPFVGELTPVDPELTPEELATMDKIEKNMFTDPVENVNVGGVTINGAFAVAESASQAGVGELTMPDQLGAEILSEAVFRLDFYHGNNPHDTKVEPTDADRAEFFDRWAKVQRGELPCSAIQVRPSSFDAQVAGPDQQQIPLEIMCGNGAPSAGARQIDGLEVQIVKGFGEVNEAEQRFEHDEGYPRMVLTGAKSMGDGFETEVDGTTLRIKVGLIWKLNNPSLNVAMLISNMFDWLRVNNGKPTQFLKQNNQDGDTGREWIEAGFEIKDSK